MPHRPSVVSTSPILPSLFLSLVKFSTCLRTIIKHLIQDSWSTKYNWDEVSHGLGMSQHDKYCLLPFHLQFEFFSFHFQASELTGKFELPTLKKFYNCSILSASPAFYVGCWEHYGVFKLEKIPILISVTMFMKLAKINECKKCEGWSQVIITKEIDLGKFGKEKG